ncbi:unnamed protein product [Rotaria magnacalcarata]|uniref:ubiquitinyl hydrolase 1 n=1 Tax=Rotaria magnacalcarata TaxID=392030 RepID=A0A817A1C8_9BILA|nr:unnamed protein product [Rotaria magnacalcarata]
MLPIIRDEHPFDSYKFQDSNDFVIVNFYAKGAIEQKDFEVLTDVDSLEVSTPAGEKWSFQLYEHVYSDRTEMKIDMNETRTQTTLEVRLYKQQIHTVWPQLYSLQTVPITPQQNDLNNDPSDRQINSNTEQQEEPIELSLKNIKIEFMETNFGTVVLSIHVKQVSKLQIRFTETNFTAIFQTDDEEFLQRHSIPAKRLIKLFVRVKERIKPDECFSRNTAASIEVKLIKENQNGSRWNQLGPNEYSDAQQIAGSTLLSLADSNDLTSIRKVTQNTSADAFEANLHANRLREIHNSRPLSHIKDNISRPTMSILLPPSIGYTGIYNPANSCFMNAAVQCLSNTRELRDYFLHSYHSLEINQVNPLGMKGAMAEEFGKIIQELWCGKYSYIIANQLRDYAAKRHQEFVGNGQHDAQELLTILLDAIHEDLNRVISKPLVPPIEDENRPDEIIADEYWRGYLSRNDSIIVQLFTGQFKSKTKCPQCHKESVTFDPFTSISVPLPKYVSVDTIVIFQNIEKPPTKYRVVMSSDGSIGELKRRVSSKCGLPIPKMLAYKMQNNHSIEFLKDTDQVPTNNYSWNSFDMTCITETLTSAECNDEKIISLTFYQRIFKAPDYISSCGYCQAPPKPDSSPIFCNHCYRVAYCDEDCLKFNEYEHQGFCEFRTSDNYETVGLPFIVSRSVEVHIEHSKSIRRSSLYNNGFSDNDDDDDDDDDDRFSDIENTDWVTIKSILSTSDSWSIVRIGDYFVKKNKNKKSSKQKLHTKENIADDTSTNNNNEQEPMVTSHDNVSNTEDFDMLDDICTPQPLYRIMPHTTNDMKNDFQSIIEPGDDAEKILRSHTSFSIDWFTENNRESAFRVTSSMHRSGISGLVDDESVSSAFSKDQDVTLQQCLQLFIEPEVLGPDDKWYCPHCKEHIQAEKKMSVWRLPPILIIHLKRFKYSHCSSLGYMSSSREKIDTTIKFPIRDLNMAPYCSSISADNQQHEALARFRYDLYGVINHCGSAWFGHYTSNARLLAFNDSAKTDIGWRLFNDQSVSSFANDKDLVRSDAYVLFYRHRNLPVQFTLQEQLQRALSESFTT